MNLFAIDPGLAIWTWIVFGLLFLILWKFALPPLLKSLKEREAVIAGSVDSALQIEKRLSDINTEREEIIRLTKNEADSLLHSARADAETLRTNLLSQAEQEAREMLPGRKKKLLPGGLPCLMKCVWSFQTLSALQLKNSLNGHITERLIKNGHAGRLIYYERKTCIQICSCALPGSRRKKSPERSAARYEKNRQACRHTANQRLL